jgi:glycosyltransferase involved in cell wall biosynthesis
LSEGCADLRVLLTTHQFFPRYTAGTEVAALSTGIELLARGHEVHVLTVDPTLHRESADIGYKDYDYQGLMVRALELPRPTTLLEGIRNEYENALVADHVRRYVERVKPDVVHMFHIARLSGSVIGVFRELNVPLVFTTTDFWSICVRNTLMKPSGDLSTGPDEISSNCLECRGVEKFVPSSELPEIADKQQYYREIAQRALAQRQGEHQSMVRVRAMLARTESLRERVNAVDAILAPTKIMRQMLVENGIDQELVSVSPYGMNTSRFQDFERPAPERGKLRVGYMGQIAPAKGLHILIEGFKRLPEDSGATLRISGDLKRAPNPDYSCEIYELAGEDPRINFAGAYPNDRVADELKKIDVLVVPSTWYENSPLVIYEALASRMPVVATDLGGMSEVVHHRENGLLFEPGDAEDLARQLNRLISEPGLLEELGNNAGHVRTVQDSVDEVLELYERLRNRRPHEQRRERMPEQRVTERRTTEKRFDEPQVPRMANVGKAPNEIKSTPATSAVTKSAPPKPATNGGHAQPTGPISGSVPVFFVIGRAKSGTTWLTRMLDSHPEILCKGEGIFFGRGTDLGFNRQLMTPTSLQGALADSEHLRTWIERRPMWTGRKHVDQHLANLVRMSIEYFLKEELAASGKRIVGDKTPLITADDVREISSVMPEAKVIHVIRDGRDTAVSVVHHEWNRTTEAGGHLRVDSEALRKRDAYRADPEGFVARGESIFSAGKLEWHAKDWAELVGKTTENGPILLGENYTEVRYEDMLEQPVREVRRLLEFLGADSSEETAQRCVERHSFERKTRRQRGQEDSTAFLRKGIAGDWKNVFTEGDKRIFKREAGWLLLDLGYEKVPNW